MIVYTLRIDHNREAGMTTHSKRRTRPGHAPGQLLEEELPGSGPVTLSVIEYDEDAIAEHRGITLDECSRFFDSPKIAWLHCQGQATAKLLQKLGEAYHLHPLAMEDVINQGQRSKVEVYDESQIFVCLNLPCFQNEQLMISQISLFLGPGYLVSFSSAPTDIFDPIRQRLHGPVGRFRRAPADYLLYALIDLIVDHAFPLLEEYDEFLENLETTVLDNPQKSTLDDIHFLKRELLLIRKSLSPQREALNQLIRDEHPLISDNTKIYLRDVYDHSLRVLEMLETFRETSTGLMDVYLSSLSNRMNDVMKVLTIIATIFIPLSFFTGLYGMNFNTDSPYNMPELNFRYGYLLLLGFLVTVAVGMLALFRKHKWL